MTAHGPLSPSPVFPREALSGFASAYPEQPCKLRHELRSHPLLTLAALAELAESMLPSSVEYNRGDLPIGVDGKPEGTGLSIGETIRSIETSNSWAVLKNVEQNAAYARLLADLIGELESEITQRTGRTMNPQAFVFISSPSAITPYHFDPEHNILLQLAGEKTMVVFPAGDTRFAPDEAHEAYHTGGPRELRWKDEFASGGTSFPLASGDALYVPVMAPHFVRNGTDRSVSLSITWRSQWSMAEADARAFNALLRRFGYRPKATKRWPAGNSAKAVGWRFARRLPQVTR